MKDYIHWKIICYQSVTMFKSTLSKFRALRMPKIILMRKELSSSITKATEELRWFKKKISRRLRKKDTQLKINMKNTKNPWKSLKKEDIWKVESKFWHIRNQRLESSEVNPVQKKQTPWKSRNQNKILKKTKYQNSPKVQREYQKGKYHKNPEFHKKYWKKRYQEHRAKKKIWPSWRFPSTSGTRTLLYLRIRHRRFYQHSSDYLGIKNITFSLQNCIIQWNNMMKILYMRDMS